DLGEDGVEGVVLRRRPDGVVVDLDRGQSPARGEDAPRFAEGSGGLGEWLEEPHHPDVVERPVRERKRERVGDAEIRPQTERGEVPAGRGDLSLLDVDPGERDTGEGAAENAEDGADAAADLEQPRPLRE